MDLEQIGVGEWPNVAMEPGTLKHAATGERVERPDSAERLAADILAKSHTVALTRDGDFEQVESYVNVPVSTVRGWLDRQAAITRGETCQSWQDATNVLDRTNLQTIDELTAERDEWKAKAEAKSADCARNDDYTPESDVSATDVDANDANAAQDTREKLEADVRNVVSQWFFETGWSGSTAHGMHEEVVMRWLDRQGAITERECREYENELRKQHHRRCADLKAEADYNLSEAQRYAKAVANWEDEALHLREVVRTQADSFRGMEAELKSAHERIAELESGSELNTMRLSVAGLKRTVDEQRGTILAQRAELARFNERLHGRRQLPKHAKWPRFEDGKLVKVGRDCARVEMREKTYTLHGSDAEAWSAAYGDAAPDSWRKSEWRC